ncbi:alpha/beta-hydrolase [Exidia glandulosa HHB12029]|uniref:Alpha/beta-hydrolase n=1 Tax=Exidia glandulosa HHB12029 TaxID=1314781 RepID=A0A166ART9_EXIGL|nr:alpha/beta-hydrolase [Exidia glandulosa HHB12029]
MLIRYAAFLLAVLAAAGASQSTPHTRSYFYVGNTYRTNADGTFADGQMYVEHLRPVRVEHRVPLVMIHGLSQSGTNWVNTPDGRPGWADFFLSKGYELYIVDQPARARSAWNAAFDGNVSLPSTLSVAQRFTAPERFNIWPAAKFHTQWPGAGVQGDAIFDEFYASQMQSLDSNAETDTKIQHAGAALLDKIGTAILMTHSQAGPLGWLIADARPRLVRAIVALEPSGPPFFDTTVTIPPAPARPFGIADIPITYDPPLTSATDLERVLVVNNSVTVCFKQAEPARQLVNLQRIPVLAVTTQASYHAHYDWCTVEFMRQAGVNVQHISLPEVGIRGNGHMMFLEKNSDDIAALVERWVAEHD